MADDYDPHKDDIGSWREAVKAIRYQAIIKGEIPADDLEHERARRYWQSLGGLTVAEISHQSSRKLDALDETFSKGQMINGEYAREKVLGRSEAGSSQVQDLTPAVRQSRSLKI